MPSAPKLADQAGDDLVPRRSIGSAEALEQHSCRAAEIRIELLTRGYQIADEADPAAIVFVDPKPQDAAPRPTGKVSEQRGLAVAGLGRDEDDPGLVLGGQPIEQPVTLERLGTKRGTLDLGRLEREFGHTLPRLAVRGRTGLCPPRTDWHRDLTAWGRLGCPVSAER